MANQLAAETSPYLLQHRDNPVDWRPWGEEALEEARAEDKPVLISIGYSACHWCHVMERESFEDPAIAQYMNEHFVNVKVDREERPDIDSLYMDAVQAMTGHGGWPMTVFCDPDGVPFHGGTYFPPEPTGGIPSFRMVLEAVADTYRSRREEIRERAPGVAEQLGAPGRLSAGDTAIDETALEEAMAGIMRAADRVNGGFGGAPKFPPASALELLMGRGHDDFVELSLDRMISGGMYDQIGGGFARYSVDASWTIPHFEKMLYDNALLARLYLHAWQRFGHERYRAACTQTLDWAMRELRDSSGGFHAALDADSEGVEGRFYVWEAGDLRAVLEGEGFTSREVDEVASWFGVTDGGNFEGANVLQLAHGASDAEPETVSRARPCLLAARSRRAWPAIDDKVLTAWNALMVAALAEAGAVLGEERYTEAARECAEVMLSGMRDEDGGLLRTLTAGQARIPAFLEDYAYLVEALTVLYESTFEQRWHREARELADLMIELFHDGERGGFFTTPPGRSDLIARRKDLADHPIPSGNASAALGLQRLASLDGDTELRRVADLTIRVFAEVAIRNADSFGHMLQAVALRVGGVRELALIAPREARAESGEGASRDPGFDALITVSWEEHRPDLVRAGGAEGDTVPALLEDRPARDGHATAYLCREFTCREPVTDPERLRSQLAGS